MKGFFHGQLELVSLTEVGFHGLCIPLDGHHHGLTLKTSRRLGHDGNNLAFVRHLHPHTKATIGLNINRFSLNRQVGTLLSDAIDDHFGFYLEWETKRFSLLKPVTEARVTIRFRRAERPLKPLLEQLLKFLRVILR